MKVFITGATGYIGFNVALAYRRAGHRVFGLVRSNEKAQLLRRNEITPVLGTLQDPQSYKSIAAECAVLIHAAVDYQADTAALDKQTVQTLIEIGKKGAQPKTFIYTSGVWVYGNTNGKVVDETTPLTPLKIVSFRPQIEKMVLESGEVQGIVVRPGCVYGKQGGLTAPWFQGAYVDKSMNIVGDGTNRWAMVHVDDLAWGYLFAGQSGLAGEDFNLVSSARFTVREMAEAVKRIAGFKGEINYIPLPEAMKSMGDFAEALALDQHVSGHKALRMLGWYPQHLSFVDEVELFFESWKAAQK